MLCSGQRRAGRVFATPYARVPTGQGGSAPSAVAWVGTNDVGQDVLSQLMAGARTSLGVAVGAAFVSALLGALLGAGGTLAGGWLERLTVRMMDVGLVIPPILAAMLAAAYLQPSSLMLVGILAFFFWPGTARLLRSQTLLLRESGGDGGANVGRGPWHLLRRQFCPTCTVFGSDITGPRRAFFRGVPGLLASRSVGAELG